MDSPASYGSAFDHGRLTSRPFSYGTFNARFFFFFFFFFFFCVKLWDGTAFDVVDSVLLLITMLPSLIARRWVGRQTL